MSLSYTRWLFLVSFMEGFICIVGAFLNGIVFLTFCKNPHLLTCQNMFILSITFSDLSMSLVAVPIAWAASFRQKWPLGSTACQIHAFLVFQFGLVAITHLTAATIERYLTISKSMTSSSFLSRHQTLFVIAILWVYTLAFSVAPLIGLSRYDVHGLGVSCSIVWDTDNITEYVYFSFLFLGCFIAPVCLISFCNASLLQIMRHLRIRMFNSHGGRILKEMRRFYIHEKRALIRFAIMVLAFLTAYGPYAVVSVIVITCGSSAVHPVVVSMTAVFAKTSCLYNSLVNVLCYKRLRKEMFKLVLFWKQPLNSS